MAHLACLAAAALRAVAQLFRQTLGFFERGMSRRPPIQCAWPALALYGPCDHYRRLLPAPRSADRIGAQDPTVCTPSPSGAFLD